MSAPEPPAAYSFFPLDEPGFKIYCDWYAADTAGQWLTPPTRQWFEYLQNTPGARGWLVRGDDGRAIGLAQLDETGDHVLTLQRSGWPATNRAR